MSTYQDTVQKLGKNTATILEQLWESVQRGDLPQADFAQMAAQVVYLANEQGRAAAQAALNGYVEIATGIPSVPVAQTATVTTGELARLEKAIGTILAADQDTLMQLARLGNSEPLESAARSFSDGIKAHGKVKGWIRQLEPGACELCQWLYADGRIWPADYPIQTHKGCVCNPLPTFADRELSVPYSKFLNRNGVKK